MNISADTQQNILYTVYFIIRHNFPVFLYGGLAILTTLFGLKLPSRGKYVLIWGFLILLFAFEYNKHIVGPLRDQTLQSLITERESLRIEYYTTRFLVDYLPLILQAAGWALVIIGGLFERKKI